MIQVFPYDVYDNKTIWIKNSLVQKKKQKKHMKGQDQSYDFKNIFVYKSSLT